MSNLETAIVTLAEVFVKYAGKDDDKKKLSNAELSALIKTELSSSTFKDKVDPKDVSEALAAIDKNRDGQVSYKEFSCCVAQLSQAYFNKKYGKDMCGKGKPH